MVIESLLLAAPALGLSIATIAAVGIGYAGATCAVARIQGKNCS